MPAPVHVPWPAVSVEARWTVPVIVGLAVLTGGALTARAVAVLAALTLPSAFVTVTSSRRWRPASPAATVYVALVAPVIAVQVVPSAEDCHW